MYNQINHFITNDPQDVNDILIIDGSDDIDNISRDLAFYHTVGLAEYLSANRLYTKVIKQNDLKIEHLKLFRGFIFYQVSFTSKINKFLEKAIYFNKKIFIADYEEARNTYFYPRNYMAQFEHIDLNQDNLFFPDIIVRHKKNPVPESDKVDYLFIFNRVTDAEFITKQLEFNYNLILDKRLQIKIILNPKNKLSLSLPRKLSSIVKVEAYRNLEDKIEFIKRARVVIIKESQDLECFLNKIECQIFNTQYIAQNDRINLDKQVPEIIDHQVLEKHNTVYADSDLFIQIKNKLNENIVFNIPGTIIRGGINVIVKHANILRSHGKDVTLLSDDINENNVVTMDGELNVVSKQRRYIKQNIDKLIATLWITCFFVESYPDAKRKMYLVQSFESDFSEFGNPWRLLANNTYRYSFEYLTISKWCFKWLKKKYHQNARFCPNGLNTKLFTYVERDFSDKIRILIEGSNKDEFRNVDESFRIVNLLDPKKFEVWYLTYDGALKDWYRCDKFLHQIPYEKVAKVYQSCHILLKSSKLESFSYPPLEMMATGGIAVVAQNNGNSEYIKHRENCMVYQVGDIESAKNHIEEIVNNPSLRSKLIKNGLALAKSRSWENITNDILKLYE